MSQKLKSQTLTLSVALSLSFNFHKKDKINWHLEKWSHFLKTCRWSITNPTFQLDCVICVLNDRLLLNGTSSPLVYGRIKCSKSYMQSNWSWTSPVAPGSHGVWLVAEGIDLCWEGFVDLWMKLSSACSANWMPFQSQMSAALRFMCKGKVKWIKGSVSLCFLGSKAMIVGRVLTSITTQLY